MDKSVFKTCNDCKISKDGAFFFKSKNTKDGLEGRCKACRTKYNVANNRRRIDSLPLSERLALSAHRSALKKKSPHYTKEKRRESYLKRAAIEVERNKARHAFRWAVASGKIKKLNCLVCNSHLTQGHHIDYSKPFEVVWLCASCHKKEHIRLDSMRKS